MVRKTIVTKNLTKILVEYQFLILKRSYLTRENSGLIILKIGLG